MEAMKAVLHSQKSDLEKLWLLEILGLRETPEMQSPQMSSCETR
jgi:hypothetical protein